MMVDAYRALGALAKHPRIDPNRIAVMGFSKGAIAALYSSNERFRQMYSPPDLKFAAHIGLYTPCNITFRDDDKLTGKPIRLFHGTADDWVPVEPCRSYVERLKKSGADIALAEYPGAYHAYDIFSLKEPVRLPPDRSRPRHPCRAANASPCRLCRGLSPPVRAPCRAHKPTRRRKDAVLLNCGYLLGPTFCEQIFAGNITEIDICGSPTWARTRDLRINSPSLYQLSYQGTAFYFSLSAVYGSISRAPAGGGGADDNPFRCGAASRR